MNFARRLSIAGLLGLACATSSGEVRAGEVGVTVHAPGDAWIVGSSSIGQTFGRVLARGLEQRGFRVRRKASSSAGLARPDYRDMNAVLDDLPIDRRTAVVFLYLGVNDAQALWLEPQERRGAKRRWLAWNDDRWSSVYERRARHLFDRICARGAARVVALLPIDVKQARLQRRLQRVRELQARAAASSRCAFSISTSGDYGRFEFGGQPTRRRDGFHMTPRGARVVWKRIRARAIAAAVGQERRRRPPETRERSPSLSLR